MNNDYLRWQQQADQAKAYLNEFFAKAPDELISRLVTALPEHIDPKSDMGQIYYNLAWLALGEMLAKRKGFQEEA